MFQMRNLVFEFSRVTETAALAAYKYVARGDKDIADDAAVKAMRYMLNKTPIDGEIVIGEGEMDEAPMLFIGEKVGAGGFEVEIAVDPIDGTKACSFGLENAIAVIAATKKGCMLKAPDMYMDKIAVGPKAFGAIDINLSVEENITNIAKSLDKDVRDVGVAVLNRDRHDEMVEKLVKLGCKIFKFNDGDIAKAVLTCIPESDIDVMLGIGGAPEGVVAAAAIKALGGDFQGKLIHYDEIWDDEDSEKFTLKEKKQLEEMGLMQHQTFRMNDLIQGDQFICSITGITKGDLVDGVVREGDMAVTETLLIRGQTQTIRKIKSTHLINKKDDFLKDIML